MRLAATFVNHVYAARTTKFAINLNCYLYHSLLFGHMWAANEPFAIESSDDKILDQGSANVLRDVP
jgi:hypothetical protein